MIKLIIFDFDGTLVDTSEDIMDAINQLLHEYGKTPLTLQQVKDHIGEGFTPFIKALALEREKDPRFAEKVFDRFQFYYDKRLMEKSTFYEGAEAFLKEFQKFPDSRIGIVSNKPEYQVRIMIKAFGIEEIHLVEIFGGDRFDKKKPDPKPLQEMMRLANAKPDETVMIGDSRADVEAAKAAGTHFIGVSFGYNTVEALKGFGADRFIHHFGELLPLLVQVFGAEVG